MIKKLFIRTSVIIAMLFFNIQNILAQEAIDKPKFTNPLKADSLLDLIAIDIPRFLITYLVGPLAILFFMINAATILFTAPNPNQVANARTGMLLAVAGLVLALSSLAIIKFIEGVITG